MENVFETFQLHNHYFILRHGQSEANVAGLITSDPVQCLKNFGLTDDGIRVVTVSVHDAKKRGLLTNETVIYSSDFRRALETAEIARDILGTRTIHKNRALRERNFGAYNMKHVDFYIEIWPKNKAEQLLQKEHGVEDANSIQKRALRLLNLLEASYLNQKILIVTHGDVIQVLLAAFAKLTPEQGRTFPYTQPGELRELINKTNSPNRSE